jgi:diguanylate cyclase (GGDEF)-like protein
MLAAVAAGVAGVVVVSGNGRFVWLGVPVALLAAAHAPRRAGAALAGLGVVALADLVVVAAGVRAQPSPALLAAVAAGSVAVLVATRERLERERDVLRDYALSDPVTGIANRRSLLMRANYEIERHRRARRRFALLMLDLDGFKLLNDRFGHAAGDDLLRDVATALRHAMRGQDTVARFGGDEFCVLAPETDEHGAERLSARVTTAVRDVSAGLETVAGSVGVAIFPADGVTVSDLMRVADERLLEAKRRRPAGRSKRRAA